MSDVAEEDVKEANEGFESSVQPGQKLKKARENRNLGQDDIAKELKLDLRFIKALEEGRISELPQPVYTAGYVRAYSKLVGLLPDEIVNEYTSYQKASVKNTTKSKKEKEQIPSHYRSVQTELPKSFSVGQSQSEDRKKFNLLVSILVIAVLFAIVWHFLNKSPDNISLDTSPGSGTKSEAAPGAATSGESGDRQILDLPLPKPESQPVEEQPAQDSEQKVELKNPSGSDEKEIANELVKNAENLTELSLHYTHNSWVDIRDATGKSIIRRLGIAGRSNTVSGIAPFEVLLGYSPGVKIEFDGKPYDMSPYTDKRVARFVIDEQTTGSSPARSNRDNQAAQKKKSGTNKDSDRFLPDEF